VKLKTLNKKKKKKKKKKKTENRMATAD